MVGADDALPASTCRGSRAFCRTVVARVYRGTNLCIYTGRPSSVTLKYSVAVVATQLCAFDYVTRNDDVPLNSQTPSYPHEQ